MYKNKVNWRNSKRLAMDISSPFSTQKNNKNTLIFDFNNVTSERSDDDDESSEVLIGNF